MNQKQKIEELQKEIKKLKTEKTYLICTLDDFIVKCEDTTRTIPLRHKKYNCVLKIAAKAFAALVALGYSSLAIFCFLKGGM